MMNKGIIFEIHRLKDLGWSKRKIARKLAISKETVSKYLQNPEIVFASRTRQNRKLDAYFECIRQLLEQDPDISAPVVLQHLVARGFEGKITIVRDYLCQIRGKRQKRIAYSRFESLPGQQMQIDWGHFGSIDYDGTRRKLYALVVIEGYSRLLYVRFAHSQKQPILHQCLLDAFAWFGGSPKQLVVDNMGTAVTERAGSLVRFNGNFLDFLRIFRIVPHACTPGAPYEKGKIEAAIKYVRNNFLPLRCFVDLDDAQQQVEQWLKTVANVRIHQGTGQRPADRFSQVELSGLPQNLPECMETLTVLVHKDFAVRFDGNTYTAPPWAIGKKVTVKADQTTVSIYLKDKKIAVHSRCWTRKKRIETPSHKEQVKKLQKRLWHDRQVAAFASLGPVAVDYLQNLFDSGLPIKRHVARLLDLLDRYGNESLIYAIKKSMGFNALGSEYIENILHQQSTPKNTHPPVRLKNENLNHIRLDRPCLADYDAYVIKRRPKDD